jgi:hypothetical protein
MRIVAASLFLISCVAPADDGKPDPTDPDTQPQPEPQPESPRATGQYTMRSDVDVTVDAVLPEQAHDMVVVFRDFSVNPTQTLLDVAEDAGVPAVATIRDNLPDYVEDKLEGWINAEIAKVKLNGVPITQVAGNLAALAESVLTRFAIDSELAIDGSTATHRLKAIDFAPAGLDTKFDVGNLPNEIVSATASCSSQDGTLTLGDHGYSIAYGQYVWQAVERDMTTQYGGTIREMFGQAMNCPAIAHTVASKCVWGYCVGHETELNTICERGLDEVVARVQAKVAALRFDAVRFASGTATIAPDRLEGGVWTAEINAGVGLRQVPATFSATR